MYISSIRLGTIENKKEDGRKKCVYEWYNAENVRFRMVVGGNSSGETVISFFSNRKGGSLSSSSHSAASAQGFPKNKTTPSDKTIIPKRPMMFPPIIRPELFLVRRPPTTKEYNSCSRKASRRKVVDQNGELLVVYHGTSHGFTEFDPDMVGTTYEVDDIGLFFHS